jgi:hypothetical protein
MREGATREEEGWESVVCRSQRKRMFGEGNRC